MQRSVRTRWGIEHGEEVHIHLDAGGKLDALDDLVGDAVGLFGVAADLVGGCLEGGECDALLCEQVREILGEFLIALAGVLEAYRGYDEADGYLYVAFFADSFGGVEFGDVNKAVVRFIAGGGVVLVWLGVVAGCTVRSIRALSCERLLSVRGLGLRRWCCGVVLIGERCRGLGVGRREGLCACADNPYRHCDKDNKEWYEDGGA